MLRGLFLEPEGRIDCCFLRSSKQEDAYVLFMRKMFLKICEVLLDGECSSSHYLLIRVTEKNLPLHPIQVFLTLMESISSCLGEQGDEKAGMGLREGRCLLR